MGSKIRKSRWLGREESNLRMAESKSAALPLGYAPIAPSAQIGPAKRRDHSAWRLRLQPLPSGLDLINEINGFLELFQWVKIQ
jgi:hypothetical protein